MSFENAVIFPFPAVQYIPLPLHTIQSGMLEKSPEHPKPLLITGPAISKYAEMYRLNLPLEAPSHTCPILALHLKIYNARYRSFFITMIGQRETGRFQFFTIPSERFYKDKLFFEVFEESGRKLARYSLFAEQGIAL